jgi:sterol desaturase/sphingolipid hydroxylase (fatty acid hydroxylase superfamily)
MTYLHLAAPHARAFAVEILRLSLWLAILAAIFVPLERFFTLRPSARRDGSVAADLVFYFLNSLLPSVLLAVPLAALAAAIRGVEPSHFVSSVAALPLWVRLAAALVVGEVGAYWAHRLSHVVPFLWRFHAVHHAPEHLDWLVNTRAHPFDMVFTRLCALAPIYALGLQSSAGSSPGLVPVVVTLLGTVWSFFVHANVRWRFGVIERVVATPAFHHWHHTNDENINKNYAALLPFVDTLFGTYHLPKQWPPCYGINEQIAPTTRGQLIEPLLARR